MELFVDFGLAAGLAYGVLIVVLYVTARIHFGYVSRWMETSQQRLEAMQMELTQTRLRFRAVEEEREPAEEYEMAG